jgi:hypothetical protein
MFPKKQIIKYADKHNPSACCKELIKNVIWFRNFNVAVSNVQTSGAT